ncbi:MAG: hypothetical protein ABFS41_19295, partial [Myxococcota bacterium]
MARRTTLRQRLERVLTLAERWLEQRLGEPPPAELFEERHAFRWELEAGRGRLAPVTAASFELDH